MDDLPIYVKKMWFLSSNVGFLVLMQLLRSKSIHLAHKMKKIGFQQIFPLRPVCVEALKATFCAPFAIKETVVAIATEIVAAAVLLQTKICILCLNTYSNAPMDGQGKGGSLRKRNPIPTFHSFLFIVMRLIKDLCFRNIKHH